MLDHVPPEVAKPNLADLVRINKRFGGHSTIRHALGRAVRGERQFTVLDVGAASGDTARFIRGLYPGATVTSLDYNETNLGEAPVPKVIADAFALPFRPESFDYVISSLFLHHFTDERVAGLLRSFYGLARKAVVICDLERSIVPWLFLPASRPIFQWNTITVHDGMISVRAAFRRRELQELARRAGMGNVEMAVHRPAFRISLVARK